MGALTFKLKTSQVDGVHPRHFAKLSDDALAVLGRLLVIVELLGHFPHALCDILVALLPKPEGGKRPIGLYRGLYRLWSRLRHPHVKEWEAGRAVSGIFGVGPRRRVTDSVWRTAVRNFSDIEMDKVVIESLWDLRKCYEFVNHFKLKGFARELGFPLAILRVSLRSYRWGRRLRLDGMVGRAWFPGRGIIAGSVFAVHELRAFMFEAVTRHAVGHPGVGISVHIDDVNQRVAEDTRDEATKVFQDGAAELQRVFEVDLELPLAMSKGLLLSNDQGAATEVATKLGWSRGKSARGAGSWGSTTKWAKSCCAAGGLSGRRAGVATSCGPKGPEHSGSNQGTPRRSSTQDSFLGSPSERLSSPWLQARSSG